MITEQTPTVQARLPAECDGLELVEPVELGQLQLRGFMPVTLLSDARNDLRKLIEAAAVEADVVRRKHKNSMVRCQLLVQYSRRGPAFVVPYGRHWRDRELLQIQDSSGGTSFGFVARVPQTETGMLECETAYQNGTTVSLAPTPVPVADARVFWLKCALARQGVINKVRWNPIAVEAVLGRRVRSPRSLVSAKHIFDTAALYLDESQQNAMKRATSGDTFLWGPPGTGKSLVLAWVAAALIRSGKSVLLAAPTHVAVNGLFDRTREILDGPLATTTGSAGYSATNWSREMRPLKLSAGAPTPELHAATLARCLMAPSFAESRLVDVVVIDEGCQALLPDVLAAASCSSAHVVVGGDPRQLGAIVETREGSASTTLRAEPFVGFANGQSLCPSHPVLTTLGDSYRLPEVALDGIRLLSYPEVTLRSVAPRHKVGLIRRELGSVTVVVRIGHGPNHAHKGFTASALSWLMDENDGGAANPQLSILAPTHVELKRIRGELQSKPVRTTGLSVRTIHAMQSAEADVVVVDATSLRIRSGCFSGSRRADADSRLWNVALSRAKRHVVLLVSHALGVSTGESWIERYVKWAFKEARVVGLDTSSGWPEAVYVSDPADLAAASVAVI